MFDTTSRHRNALTTRNDVEKISLEFCELKIGDLFLVANTKNENPEAKSAIIWKKISNTEAEFQCGVTHPKNPIIQIEEDTYVIKISSKKS